MTQRNDTGIITVTAGEDLEIHRRVKLDAANEKQVVYADAGATDADYIGVTRNRVSSGEKVAISMTSKPGTHIVEAAGPVACNAAIYGAADGKIDDAVSGTTQGFALEAATEAGEQIECELF